MRRAHDRLLSLPVSLSLFRDYLTISHSVSLVISLLRLFLSPSTFLSDLVQICAREFRSLQVGPHDDHIRPHVLRRGIRLLL